MMNRVQKWFYTLTGGRPMTLVSASSAFYDHIAKEPIGYWRDKFGRVWMASMVSPLRGWQQFRVRSGHDE
jgi:hypothetical protein